MIAYEKIRGRINGTPMSKEEANEILKDTSVSIIGNDKEKYMWFAIMSESGKFNTPRSALNDAIQYIEKGGY